MIKFGGKASPEIVAELIPAMTLRLNNMSATKPPAKAILSIAKSFWNRLTKPSHVDLGPPDQDISAYPKNDRGGVSLDEAKGGKIDLKNCKVSTHEKNSKHKHSW
jgi:hypothetical protein